MIVLLAFLRHFNYIFSEKSVLPEVLLTISYPLQHVVGVQYVSLSQLDHNQFVDSINFAEDLLGDCAD